MLCVGAHPPKRFAIELCHNHVSADTEGSMEYNPMYRPRDPSDGK